MSNTNGHEQRYRIKSVANITGLSTHALRKWEERYDLIYPIRSPNGYRTFSEDDIQLLLFIKSKLKDGESIGQIAQAGPVRLRKDMQQAPFSLSLIPPPFHQDVQTLIHAARHHHPDRIQHTLDQWIKYLSLQEAMMKIIFPVLQLIGDLWHQGGISISGEHYVSQLVRQYLLTAVKQDTSGDKPQSIVACVPGDYHEIAPLTATLFLQNLGWHGTFLGPNVSFEILQTALRRKQPQLMILSCMLEPAKEIVDSWMEYLTKNIQPQCTVALGGAGFSSYETFFNQYEIPYLRTIQDINLFTPNTRTIHNTGLNAV